MTFYPHTPDNSFLGYVVEKSTLTGSSNRRKNQGVVYGKEGKCPFVSTWYNCIVH